MKDTFKIFDFKKIDLHFTNLYKRWNDKEWFIFLSPIVHLQKNNNRQEKSITLFLTFIFFTLEFNYYLKRLK